MGKDLLLRYSHNIVEHLGLKLYQNQPTRVIAEVISNSWDADAVDVSVNMNMDGEKRWVAVLDNGHGMTREQLRISYLVIGHAKRASADQTSPNGRALMGRKGIGKLAAFGIAGVVDVLTAAADESGKVFVQWLRFNLKELLEQGDGEVTYKPKIISEDTPVSEIKLSEDDTGQVTVWTSLISAHKNTGTLILMKALTLGRAIGNEQLISSLGNRFTTTTGKKMKISVNGEAVTLANSLPAFEFRVPANGELTDTVDGHEIRYWVGFVKSADWPQDQAGVGVYAHGKIAQDRPFTFGVKGKEIFSRYMLGFVEADWLDELNADLISTDRTSVNWDANELRPLYEWGKEKTRAWLSEFEKWRQQESETENRVLVQATIRAGLAPRVTEAEEEEIVRMVSSITPAFGKDEAAKERLVKAVSDAWIQKPMRRLVRDLWSSFGKTSEAPEAFTEIVERLSSHSVPESLNLAVIFAQRAFALTRLYDYVHHGREVDLQRLIERFPWIIEPDLAVLTANESLKTAIRKAEGLDQIPTGRRTIGGIPEKNKPDFVFLASPEEHQIVIVELKNPQEDLTIDNRAQLNDYMTWFEANYPDAKITGYLVGRNPARLEPKHPDIRILPWTAILQRSRARNLELLSAMLLRTGSDAIKDARAMDAIELGGPEAKKLLDQLAEEHAEIKDLMQSFELVRPRDTAD